MGKKTKKPGKGKEKTERNTAKADEKKARREGETLSPEDDIDAVLLSIQKEGDEDKDEDDSEDEGNSEESDDEDDDEEAEAMAVDGSVKVGEVVAMIKGQGKSLGRKEKRALIEQIRANLGLSDSQRTPVPGETLEDFYKRTNMYWQMAANEHTQHTGKELRKDGFDLAETRYLELKPILDELAILEAEQKAEEANLGLSDSQRTPMMIGKLLLFMEGQKIDDAVTLYKYVFDAVEIGPKLSKLHQQLAHLMYADITIAGTTISIRRDYHARAGYFSPESKVMFELETDSLKAVLEKALSAKAEVGLVEIEGGVKAIVTDPFGFRWIISSPGNTEDPEDVVIDCKRDMLMEELEDCIEFASLSIQHAIDGFVYRGPDFDFPEKPDLKGFVRNLKEMAYGMHYWIQTVTESDDEDDDAEAVDKDEDVDNAEAVDEEETVEEETDEETDEMEDEEWVGYFHRHIDSARRILTDIKSHGSLMMQLCTTLETIKELFVLDKAIGDIVSTIDEINDEQRELEDLEQQLNWS